MPFDPWNTDDGYPDDWFVPPSSSAQGTAPPTFGAPPNPFNPLLTNAPPSFRAPYIAPPTFKTQPSPFNSASTNLLPPSHPYSPYWGSLSADRLRVGAWLPPTFPDAFGRFPPPPPLPLPAPPPLPTGFFSDALKMLAERSRSAPGGLFGNLAQASGATPIFGGLFDAPANQQPTASGTPANTPSQPTSYWPAPSSLTTADPISDPRGNLLLAAFRNYLSYARAGSPAQDQQRTNDASDVVSDTSTESDDPNVILVGGDKEEDPPEKTRRIDPLTGLPSPDYRTRRNRCRRFRPRSERHLRQRRRDPRPHKLDRGRQRRSLIRRGLRPLHIY
jgi:hypothetical protein